jgi:tetratricopeptide (TPR) repeat protein
MSRSSRKCSPSLLLFLVALTSCATPHRKLPRVRPSQTEAEAATAARDWRAAAARWHALFMADPARPAEACAQAARALLELKEPESAANLLDLGLSSHPDDPDLLTLKGRALVASGFRRAAEECFEHAHAVDSRRVDALVELGRLRIDLGQESAAVVPLREAVDINGGDFETWRLLAKAHRGAGNPLEAYQSWVRAFEMGPGSADDLVEAATLYVDESVRRAHPESGDCMCKWLQSALDRDPRCTRGHFQLGVLLEEMGRRDEAIEHYRRAVEIDPGCLMALTNLAILYSSHGDERNAREMVSRALALESDGDRKKALQKLLDPFERRFKNGGTP